MKLVIIHGPPAVGKFTVANALAERTGFKVFHNHLSIDCVRSVFEFGTEAFWRINQKIRREIVAAAARQNISIIQTFCYARGEDDDNFQEFIDAAELNGGDVDLILLVCDNDERRKRIVSESRKRLGKLTDPSGIGEPHPTHDLFSPFTGHEEETLVIDNTTNVPPEEAAERIVEHFGLARLEVCE